MPAMDADPVLLPAAISARSLYPQRSLLLRRLAVIAQVVGLAAIVVGHGLWDRAERPGEFGGVVIASMLVMTVGIALRYKWSLRRPTFWSRHRTEATAAIAWTLGIIVILIGAPLWQDAAVPANSVRWQGFVTLSEVLMLACAATGAIRITRAAASGGANPAVLLVGSFAILVAIGTAALMLPRCRASTADSSQQGAPFTVALFTATSASCVTGLIVEDTGAYWSRTGHWVILGLIQVGGLGIMTFGAFFAVAAGRSGQLREFATLRELLAAEQLGDTRRLVVFILAVTLGTELTGAVLLSGLWSGRPAGEQAFQSVFHSVSAFCNAGFSLTDNSFVGMGGRWEVWGIAAGLIIIGGLGFPLLHGLATVCAAYLDSLRRTAFIRKPRLRARLPASSKLALITTMILMVGGWALVYLLELTGAETGDHPSMSLHDAWFQAVTFRTAGFNTVELHSLQPATKLLAIMLMFVGASPLSTGGGVKTVVLALTVLVLFSTFRGREKVECFGRTIQPVSVNRALAILFVGTALLMTVTLLLVMFEQRPAHILDYMFESASALGTVGVTSAVQTDSGEFVPTTRSLSAPSQLVIILAMFLGRVGPLTLMIALAGQETAARYEYPAERLTLG